MSFVDLLGNRTQLRSEIRQAYRSAQPALRSRSPGRATASVCVIAMHLRDLELWHGLELSPRLARYRDERPTLAHLTLHWRHAGDYLQWLYGKRTLISLLAIRHVTIEGDARHLPRLQALETTWATKKSFCQNDAPVVQ